MFKVPDYKSFFQETPPEVLKKQPSVHHSLSGLTYKELAQLKTMPREERSIKERKINAA